MRLEGLFLTEAVRFAKRMKFSYGSHGRSRKRPHDSRPVILVLAKWRHPVTRNSIISGLNENLLDPDEKDLVRQYLGKIQKQAERGKPGIQELCKGHVEGATPGEVGQFRRIFYKAYRSYREPLMRGRTSLRLSYHI